ncbi:MAG TPA: chlorite dismutase family protein [Candidatus Paceibacterota bacterium]|nr:chlorite dismutase family protein [Candidatus Paceibacterota bacterium]
MRYHNYFFFDAASSMRSLSRSEILSAKKDFLSCLESDRSVRFQAYATLGFKAGTRFMLHVNADQPGQAQDLLRDLLHTSLGRHLKVAYTLLGVARSSPYNPGHPPQEADWNLLHKYLVVYPFTKTTEWHLMPYDERRNVMRSHVEVGRRHSGKISQRLLYSYGMDDHEFVVSYYVNDLEDFVQLVMDMRGTESRRHTKNDLPIFTCRHMSPGEALAML